MRAPTTKGSNDGKMDVEVGKGMTERDGVRV